MLSIFSCDCWPSVCLLWRKCLLRFSAHFLIRFFFYIEFYELFYIFWILTPYLSYHLQVFSPIKYFVFSFLSVVSFVVQKLLSLLGHICLFAFVSFALGDRSKKVLLQFMSKSVLPMFSSSFMVLGLTFRLSIHFEFIFVYGVKECSNLIISHVAVQFSQHHLLKRLSFSHCVLLTPLS